MQVFRSYDSWKFKGDDNTEYPSKHNHARHRWQRVFFSDPGPLNAEPTAKPLTAPGGMRPDPNRLANLNKLKLTSLTPNHNTPAARMTNRQLRHPNPNAAQTTSHQSYLMRSPSDGELTHTPYVGTLRFKGSSVKYLRYDEDRFNRPGYWPNCRERAERWDNYRLNQWEDNRFESCSPKTRRRAMEKINKSNRSPFQSTPYSEQSATMLFYQQKLAMSKSMPQLRPSTGLNRTRQNERIFDFTRTQRKLTRRQDADEDVEEDEEGGDEEVGAVEEGEEGEEGEGRVEEGGQQPVSVAM